VYRLRQDVKAAGTDPLLFDKLKDVRTLEYEVDYLTNKIKVRGCEGRGCFALAGVLSLGWGAAMAGHGVWGRGCRVGLLRSGCRRLGWSAPRPPLVDFRGSRVERWTDLEQVAGTAFWHAHALPLPSLAPHSGSSAARARRTQPPLRRRARRRRPRRPRPRLQTRRMLVRARGGREAPPLTPDSTATPMRRLPGRRPGARQQRLASPRALAGARALPQSPFVSFLRRTVSQRNANASCGPHKRLESTSVPFQVLHPVAASLMALVPALRPAPTAGAPRGRIWACY
jgi:hypothetical protein